MNIRTASASTCAIEGVEAVPVTVEVAVSDGLPGFDVIGMHAPDAQETRLRVRTALRASGFSVASDKHVTVSLAPASPWRRGARYDFPIAAAFLAATGQIQRCVLDGRVLAGELSLTGEVRADCIGIYGTARFARETGRELLTGRLLSTGARLPERHLEATCLADLRDGVFAERVVEREVSKSKRSAGEDPLPGHANVLLVGNCDRAVVMAKRHAESLPALADDELDECACIYSAARADAERIARGMRPLRAPHSSVTAAGMVGGGRPVLPGEASLAHNGVLLLENVQDIRPAVLQALRQPVEEGAIHLVRAERSYELPARFQLIACAPPCVCGHFGDPERECVCSERRVREHQSRLEGIARMLRCEVVRL